MACCTLISFDLHQSFACLPPHQQLWGIIIWLFHFHLSLEWIISSLPFAVPTGIFHPAILCCILGNLGDVACDPHGVGYGHGSDLSWSRSVEGTFFCPILLIQSFFFTHWLTVITMMTHACACTCSSPYPLSHFSRASAPCAPPTGDPKESMRYQL